MIHHDHEMNDADLRQRDTSNSDTRRMDTLMQTSLTHSFALAKVSLLRHEEFQPFPAL